MHRTPLTTCPLTGCVDLGGSGFVTSLPLDLLHAELRRRQESPEKPECGTSGKQGHYNTGAHVFALFLILGLSTLGTHSLQHWVSWCANIDQHARFRSSPAAFLTSPFPTAFSSSPDTSELASSSQQPLFISSQRRSCLSQTRVSQTSGTGVILQWQEQSLCSPSSLWSH